MPPNGAEEVRTSLLEDAVDVPVWLTADRDTPFETRVRRDRAVGLAGKGRSALAQVRAWWAAVRPTDRSDVGARLKHARTLISVVLAVAGAVLGGVIALAVLRYTGEHPVNVVSAIALLVALPLLLLVTSVGLLSRRGIFEALSVLNLGRIGAGFVTRLARLPDDVAARLGWSPVRAGPARRFARWQMVVWSQIGGLAFALGALGTAFALVVFTDLAFGWSTTLDVTAAEARRIVAIIALPWSSWLPQAVPDAALIDASRFFRLEGAAGEVPMAGRLTGWWPFLLMSLLCYGVAPRFVLLVLAGVQLARATRSLLLDDGEVRALLDRLNSANVAAAGEPGVDSAPSRVSASGDAPPVTLDEAPRLVVWNGVLPAAAARDWLRERFGVEPLSVIEAGGSASLADDRQALQALPATDDKMVLVLTKSWEPPVLEFIDFLTLLRQRLGNGASVVVVPLPLGDTGVDDEAIAYWRRGVARLGDAGVYVQAV